MYDYDQVGQLLSVTKDGSLVEEYRYDDNGNRTYEMNAVYGSLPRSLVYSEEDYILTAGQILYAFDTDDRLAERTLGSETTQYSYSSTGELLSITLPDTTQITYTYDPLGRRIAKTVNSTVKEKYLWSGQTKLLAVYDGSDNLYQRFIYADNRMPYAMTMGGITYYLSYDQVGSLKVITDNAGNIVKTIDYDSFGNIINDSNPSFEIPFGFAGGLHDRDTNLILFGFRDYMPEIGKWSAKDPIMFAGGDTNLYAYVLNNPVMLVDPNGQIGIQIVGGLIGAAINAYNSRDLYAQGEYGKFWASVGTGVITGVTATLGGGLVGGMLAGALSSQANVVADHVIRRDSSKELDIAELDSLAQKMTTAGLKGVAGGFIGGAGTFVGKTFNLPGMSNLTFKTAGAITGTAASAAASISMK